MGAMEEKNDPPDRGKPEMDLYREGRDKENARNSAERGSTATERDANIKGGEETKEETVTTDEMAGEPIETGQKGSMKLPRGTRRQGEASPKEEKMRENPNPHRS